MWIVRKQDVRNVAADQWFEADEHSQSTAVRRALALIVHTDQIERAAPPVQFGILVAKQLHSVSVKQCGGFILSVSVNFVIAVAAPYAERRAQPGKLGDAVLERVGSPC